MKIEYLLSLNETEVYRYALEISADTKLLETKVEQYPEWTKLGCYQCPNCTLSRSEYTHCPVAVNLISIMEDAKDLTSYSVVSLRVTTQERTTTCETTVQNALRSIIGLVMAASDCPHMRLFRPLVLFHLPLATNSETAFRSLSAILVERYLHQGNVIDKKVIEGDLTSAYENLQVVNESFAKRINFIANKDASANALINLHMLSCSVHMDLQDNLKQMREIFRIAS